MLIQTAKPLMIIYFKLIEIAKLGGGSCAVLTLLLALRWSVKAEYDNYY